MTGGTDDLDPVAVVLGMDRMPRLYGYRNVLAKLTGNTDALRVSGGEDQK
jgi:hypothetical protein